MSLNASLLELATDELDLLELVEYEVRELLDQYSFAGASVPVIAGSAKKAIEENFFKSDYFDRLCRLIP